MSRTWQETSDGTRTVVIQSIADLLQRKPLHAGGAGMAQESSTGSVRERSAVLSIEQVVGSPGMAMDPARREQFESRFNHDFSQVQLHTGAAASRSARAINAAAYTMGNHVVLDDRSYRSGSREGGELLAHELAHVVQQRGGSGGRAAGSEQLERQADNAAAAVTRGEAVAPLSATGPSLQRRISIRDVGRGEQSGMARLDEFIARMNQVSTGLDYHVEGGLLLVEPREGGRLNEFDRQMQNIIDDAADIPMRLTNRHGLLGNRTVGYHWGIELDTWQSGYVDVDDMLASSPSGFMTSLVHLLRERQRTRNYRRRIGSPSLDANQPGPAAEFRRVHRAGLDAELAILRDYLGDPSVHFINRNARVLTNDRGDRIRERLTGTRGINASNWMVRLHGTRREITLEEYRELLERERIADQVRRERLHGAAEHFGPGGGVPAP